MSEMTKAGDLKRKKKQFIEKYPSLTEEDFEFDNKDELMIHLQQKLGKTKEEMRELIRKM